ncbi:unnamed protein product [Lepeophtheirus salmonis]|uniref:(salmon louse) hypothetical protein n=1 Tax=Lepeophtheirus salmonis TaxID=72036 RepID=A0A7R8CLC9_LEPSM|nr:unnamed protein product [Lepeophtheirus salmonis]CAF2855347.1 unnamed protein product [Lepeophtheirus salmonis]
MMRKAVEEKNAKGDVENVNARIPMCFVGIEQTNVRNRFLVVIVVKLVNIARNTAMTFFGFDVCFKMKKLNYHPCLPGNNVYLDDHCKDLPNANLEGSTLEDRAHMYETKFPAQGYGLWSGFKRGPHQATSHL